MLWIESGDNFYPLGLGTVDGWNTHYQVLLDQFSLLWGLLSTSPGQSHQIKQFLERTKRCLVVSVILRGMAELDVEDIGFVTLFWSRLPRGAVVQAGFSTGSKEPFYFFILVRRIVLETMCLAKASPVKPPVFAPRKLAPPKGAESSDNRRPQRVSFADPVSTALNDSPDKAKMDFLASMLVKPCSLTALPALQWRFKVHQLSTRAWESLGALTPLEMAMTTRRPATTWNTMRSCSQSRMLPLKPPSSASKIKLWRNR